MGELKSAGEKGQRQLLISILPRLAQMENLPASLIPQLLQILSTSSDRWRPRSLGSQHMCSSTLHATFGKHAAVGRLL